MANNELDRQLAEAVGYRYADTRDGEIRVYKDKSNIVPRYFRPRWYMNDAVEVADKLDSSKLELKFYRDWRQATIYLKDGSCITGEAETAAMAICNAALKVIEEKKKSE